jgi:hypothetical protein
VNTNKIIQPQQASSSVFGKVRLTTPDCPEFGKIEDIQCGWCGAFVNGDIMRMAYFRRVTEKLGRVNPNIATINETAKSAI